MAAPSQQDPADGFRQPGMNRSSMVGLPLSILLNGVAPYVLYQALTGQGVPIVNALAITAIFPVIGLVVGWVRTRHLDTLAIIALVLIVIGQITGLAFQAPAVFLIKESFVTGALGVACLISLLLPRPAMFYVGRYFASGGNPAVAQRYNALWQYPYFRFTQRLITTVWAAAYIAEALIRLALVRALGTSKQGVATILAISPLLLGGVTLLALAWTFWYVRRSVAKGRQQALAAQAAAAGETA